MKCNDIIIYTVAFFVYDNSYIIYVEKFSIGFVIPLEFGGKKTHSFLYPLSLEALQPLLCAPIRNAETRASLNKSYL